MVDITNLPTKVQWERIGVHPHHGIALPLSALRSKKSCGIGEFLDLIPLIDWCKSIGFDTIQLLPLNDSGLESSPYNAFSSTALNPVYLSLWALPHLHDLPVLQKELVHFEKYQSLPKVAYRDVVKAKMDFLYRYSVETTNLFKKNSEYLTFLEKHSWVKEYALYRSLKDKYSGQSWSSWPPELHNPTKPILATYYSREEKRITFFSLLQYLSYKQLVSVKDHAHKENIFLMGDMPILQSPDSEEVWLSREDFNLDFAAGAPPDQFSKEGQYWGFPLYRWDQIEKNDFQGWRKRLQFASEFYDIYRLDHIIGLYRIWAIFRGDKAVNGHFIPGNETEAKKQGEWILKNLISSTNMLPIGEDLALYIDHIRASMKDLGIPGTKILRWQKWYGTSNDFIPIQQYPELSLTSVSTHDTDTLAQWWRNDPEEAKNLCRGFSLPYEQTLTRHLRYEILKLSHKTSSIFHINPLQEYLNLYPELSWPNIDDERINVPSTVNDTNWCYRFFVPIEQFTTHNDLANTLRTIIE